MALTYTTAMKSLRMTAVRDGIDVGPGNGSIEIGTSGMSTVLATIPLAATCGTVTDGVLTFSMPQTDSSADDTGIAAAAQIKDGNGTVVISGLTVGTSAANIILDNTSIAAGQGVTLSAASITHA